MEYDFSPVLERIKHLKAQKSLTNEELAKKTNIPIGTLSKLLAGIIKEPKIGTLIAIADALGVSSNYLAYGKDTHPQHFALNNTEIEHIKKYRTLDEGGRQTVDAVLQIQYDIAVARQESTGLTAENERELEAYKQELLAAQKGQTSAALESTVKAASV